jgi:putative oxidoreductase
MDFSLGLARLVLGGLFIGAALSKLPNMEVFAEETANYRMLPAALVPLFSAGLVGVELLAGALMVLGVSVRATALILGGLLSAFIVGLSQALLRGIDLRCGCFGGADLATWGTVGRDIVLLALCLLLLRFGGGRLRRG